MPCYFYYFISIYIVFYFLKLHKFLLNNRIYTFLTKPGCFRNNFINYYYKVFFTFVFDLFVSLRNIKITKLYSQLKKLNFLVYYYIIIIYTW